MELGTRRGAEIIVDCLVDRGVPYVFVGPPTNQQFAFLDALYDRTDRIRPIVVRHEAQAPLMADGWFKATRRPGVFNVGTGPAIANSVLGVMSSYSCGAGIIGISGQAPTSLWGRNAMQEVQGKTWADGHRILEPIVKRYWQVPNARRLPEVIGQAFTTAVSGRPGPVLVDVPMDVLEAPVDDVPRPVQAAPSRPGGDPEAVRHALELLGAAPRAVILAGGGAAGADASAELVRVAEKLRLPVVTTTTGKGVIPADHPLAFGAIGVMGSAPAMRAAAEADVVLALGTRLTEWTTSSWLPGLPFERSRTRLIQVDIEPTEIGRSFPVELGIAGDVRHVLAQLLALPTDERGSYGTRPEGRDAWLRDLETLRDDDSNRATAPPAAGTVRADAFIRSLRGVLPRDAIVLPDAGNHGSLMDNIWPAYEPQTYIVDKGSHAMGYAPCAALGVKLARPERTVVVVTGDGSFTQVNWVLATAQEHGIAVKFVIIDDGALGGCVGAQEAFFDGRIIGTRFEIHSTGAPYRQDFVQLAAAYGVPAGAIDDPSEVSDAIRRMVQEPGPYLLVVSADPSVRATGAGAISVSRNQEPVAGARAS
jgi:acetolactate synthase-1/2/3 large subunit